MSLATRIDRLEKNYIINGAFDFFQRNTSAVTLTSTSSYLNADRFKHHYVGTVTGTPQVQRSTNVPAYSAKYSQQFITRRNASALTLVTMQRIEAVNVRELVLKPISVSAKINSDIATTVRLQLAVPTAEDNYTATTEFYNQVVTIVADSTWKTVAFENITVPLSAVNGLQVSISLECSSGTDAANKNHYITEIMLNGGIEAIPYARVGKTTVDELSFCQRYYEKSFEIDETPIFNDLTTRHISNYNTNGSGLQRSDSVFFSTTKRSAPIVVTYSPFGITLNTVHREPAGASGANYAINSVSFRHSFHLSSTGASGAGLYLYGWTADAEL
jgi:hypothetical protein